MKEYQDVYVKKVSKMDRKERECKHLKKQIKNKKSRVIYREDNYAY